MQYPFYFHRVTVPILIAKFDGSHKLQIQKAYACVLRVWLYRAKDLVQGVILSAGFGKGRMNRIVVDHNAKECLSRIWVTGQCYKVRNVISPVAFPSNTSYVPLLSERGCYPYAALDGPLVPVTNSGAGAHIGSDTPTDLRPPGVTAFAAAQSSGTTAAAAEPLPIQIPPRSKVFKAERCRALGIGSSSILYSL